MVDPALAPSDPGALLRYLSEEAPGELERLRSLDTVASWGDCGPLDPDYRNWLRSTYRLFRCLPVGRGALVDPV
jgi:hypothetical protein